ncbi:MAG: hypothetical protein R6X05_06975 [Desulfobacterales bacterium]
MIYRDKNDTFCKTGLADRICIALFSRYVYCGQICGKSDEEGFHRQKQRRASVPAVVLKAAGGDGGRKKASQM